VSDLDDACTKQLYYMLERPEGCDATVTADSFVVQYGWHLAHHHYEVELAAGVLRFLVEAAPDGLLPAGTLRVWYLDNAGRRPQWAYGARRVWIDESPERTLIMIRDATIDPGPARPPPIEPAPVFVTGEHPCPHCGVVPERYRRLRDGALVCLACGASSIKEP
jgi:hypothetical protein